MLNDLGHRDEVLATAEEAVARYRELAQLRPDALLPDLARSFAMQARSSPEPRPIHGGVQTASLMPHGLAPNLAIGRREDGQRSATGFEDREPIAGTQTDGILIDRSAERVVLPAPRGISPHQLRVVGGGEPFESTDVLVGDRRRSGLRHKFLPDEVGTAIHRILQGAGEQAHLNAGERDLQPGAGGPDLGIRDRAGGENDQRRYQVLLHG